MSDDNIICDGRIPATCVFKFIEHTTEDEAQYEEVCAHPDYDGECPRDGMLKNLENGGPPK